MRKAAAGAAAKLLEPMVLEFQPALLKALAGMARTDEAAFELIAAGLEPWVKNAPQSWVTDNGSIEILGEVGTLRAQAALAKALASLGPRPAQKTNSNYQWTEGKLTWALAKAVSLAKALGPEAREQLMRIAAEPKDPEAAPDAHTRINALRGLAAAPGPAETKWLEALAAGTCDGVLPKWPRPFEKWNELLVAGDSLEPACWARAALGRKP